jgi:uncharacterized membrane protein YeaQ/YmgE (transglycosylase-associated protein family)
MSLTGLIILAIIAAVCGAIGKALCGRTRGGPIVSIVLGFIGASIGPWVVELSPMAVTTALLPWAGWGSG